MVLPRERVRRKRVPHALHRMGLHLGPLRHCGESAATAHRLQYEPWCSADARQQTDVSSGSLQQAVHSNLAHCAPVAWQWQQGPCSSERVRLMRGGLGARLLLARLSAGAFCWPPAFSFSVSWRCSCCARGGRWTGGSGSLCVRSTASWLRAGLLLRAQEPLRTSCCVWACLQGLK